jgi:hypothetical protein
VNQLKISFTLIDDDGKEFFGEATLTAQKQKKSQPTKVEKKYSGLKGGIEFLIDNQFLNTLKTSGDVYTELKKENYFHTLQSVDKRLRFLVSKKALTRIKENNQWKYAVRK